MESDEYGSSSLLARKLLPFSRKRSFVILVQLDLIIFMGL